MRAASWASALLLLWLPATVSGAEWFLETGIEVRLFPSSPEPPESRDQDASVYIEPDFYHDWQDGEQRFALNFFARLDSADDKRTHADFGELYWRRSFDGAELFVGLRTVFWGVTESLHLVDILNQSDIVEDLDGEDKLGQPMVNLSLIRDWGTLEFFVMPYFRERTFPGKRGRLRPVTRVDTSNPIYESSDEQNHIDYAVRWSHYIGDWDLGVAHFTGTGRQPSFVPRVKNAATSPEIVLVPRYELIDQTSIDVQATKGDWLWKAEAIRRRDDTETFHAFAGGFEYTLVGLLDTAIDLGLVTEYLWDGRDDRTSVSFQNDIVAGTRFGFNDTQSSELLVLLSVDLDDGSRFGSIEGSRRLGENWSLSLEVRTFSNVDEDNQLFFLRNDDYVELALSRFFR